MKFTVAFLLVLCLSVITSDAQPPQRMSYQAVIRNASNVLVTNSPVGLRVSILQGSASGTEVYKEVFNPNPVTNANGLVTVEIGGGIPVTGVFSVVNWSNGPFFIKIETDPVGGTNYTLTVTSQLLSVPYALYSGTAFNSSGKRTIILSDTISDAQAQAKIAAEFGTSTEAIRIVGCSRLTNVDLSMVSSSTEIVITDNPKLQIVNLSNLKNCFGRFVIAKCPSLTTLNVTNLYSINGTFYTEDVFIQDNYKLVSLSFPSLKFLSGVAFIRNNAELTAINAPLLENANNAILFIENNKKLSSINFSSLKTISMLRVRENHSITVISFPALNSIGSFAITQNNAITSVSLPLLSVLGDSSLVPDGSFDFGIAAIDFNPNLSSITLGTLSKLGYNNNVSFGYNKLSSTQVNIILAKLVAINPTFSGVRIGVAGQTPSAPPTGQGITDKNTLIARGNSVDTD